MNNFLKTKSEIGAWLKQYKITNYRLVEDKTHGYVVNVSKDVVLSKKKLEFIPVKFNIVEGNFVCNDNALSDLSFAPLEVYGDFNCMDNELESLRGAPRVVSGSFNCEVNNLTSLSGVSKKIGCDFNCSFNDLKNLLGGPEIVGGAYDCSNNRLTSLDGAPQNIPEYFNCMANHLTSLKFCPQTVGRRFMFATNCVENLEFFPSYVGSYVYASGNLKLGDKEMCEDFMIFYAEHKFLNQIKKDKELLEKTIGLTPAQYSVNFKI